MHSITILEGVEGPEVGAVLRDLCDVYNGERPPTWLGAPGHKQSDFYVDLADRPVYMKQHDAYLCGIYTMRAPTDDPLMMVGLDPLDGGRLRVLTWCSRKLRMRPGEFNAMLLKRFSPGRRIVPGVPPSSEVGPAETPAPVDAGEPGREPAVPAAETKPPTRGRGAPVHPYTRKLQAAIEALTDKGEIHTLYDRWLLWYQEERGFAPRDPASSFREAVKGCLSRIERGVPAY